MTTLNQRRFICLAYLNPLMLGATSEMIGEMIHHILGGSTNHSAVGANVVGALRKKGYVTYLPDEKTWRITPFGRDAVFAAGWINGYRIENMTVLKIRELRQRDRTAKPDLNDSGGIMEAQGGVIDREDGKPKHYYAKFGKTPEETWVTFAADAKVTLADLMHIMQTPYVIRKPAEGWRTSFTEDEKQLLRPIAETLAMLDSNAFFSANHYGREHYEFYLPEADALFQANGGLAGWAGQASFVKKATK